MSAIFFCPFSRLSPRPLINSAQRQSPRPRKGDPERATTIERRHPSTMTSPADKNSVAAAEAFQATGESHNNTELHQDQHPPETQAAEPEHSHPLAKQASLLSLTLDEIQTIMCEPGKGFGSMNIDDLLTNIWTVGKGGAAEGGVIPEGVQTGVPDSGDDGGSPPPTSLCREGSLPIKVPLCRKAVDEVWSEIHREEQQAPQGNMQPRQHQDIGDAPHHPTLGEMTLEDFLVKAGVVREGGYLPCFSPAPVNQFPLQSQQLQQKNRYGLCDPYRRAACGGPVGAVGYDYEDHQNHPTIPANGVYHGHHRHQQKVLIGNNHVGVGSSASPVSSDVYGAGPPASSIAGGEPSWGGSRRGGGRAGAVGTSGGGGDPGAGGRKRILDGGAVEKVVERRQRRMMKNRESAARSRARKQAYTVDLEKEINLLKEENARLQEEQRRATARRRQMLLESMAEQSEVNLQRNAKMLRQCCSCVW